MRFTRNAEKNNEFAREERSSAGGREHLFRTVPGKKTPTKTSRGSKRAKKNTGSAASSNKNAPSHSNIQIYTYHSKIQHYYYFSQDK